MREIGIKPILLEFEKKLEAYTSTTTRADALLSFIHTYRFNQKSLSNIKDSVREMNVYEETGISELILTAFISGNNFNQVKISKTKPSKSDEELFSNIRDLLEEIVYRKDNNRATFLGE